MATLAGPGGRRRALLLMLLRLLLFLTVAAWVSRNFGSIGALSLLAGAIASRWMLVVASKKT